MHIEIMLQPYLKPLIHMSDNTSTVYSKKLILGTLQ